MHIEDVCNLLHFKHLKNDIIGIQPALVKLWDGIENI